MISLSQLGELSLSQLVLVSTTLSTEIDACISIIPCRVQPHDAARQLFCVRVEEGGVLASETLMFLFLLTRGVGTTRCVSHATDSFPHTFIGHQRSRLRVQNATQGTQNVMNRQDFVELRDGPMSPPY